MNKAFVKEESGLDDDETSQAVPDDGLKINYITPAGAERLQAELRHLRFSLRPEITNTIAWAAGNGDRSENGDYTYNKKRLREVDRRIRFLSRRLEIAEVVDPLKVAADQVMFSATVTIRDEEDNEKTYTIVGVDEVDVSKGRISWVSPLGSALLKARKGDMVTFRYPRGVQEVEVMNIRYVEIP